MDYIVTLDVTFRIAGQLRSIYLMSAIKVATKDPLMTYWNYLFKTLAIATTLVLPAIGQTPASSGRVLIVLSAAHELELKDGKVYTTGVYLDELSVPLKALTDAGYTAVFATPNGIAPSIDPWSEKPWYFHGDASSMAANKQFLDQQPGFAHPRKLSDIVAEGTADYIGVFVPGGFAPMQDLPTDPNLGKILLSFHASGRPIGMICHGPIALLSTMAHAREFEDAMISGELTKAHNIAKDWPFAGYRLTVFSSTEELLAKPQFRGEAKYFVSDALSQAGAHVDRVEQAGVNVIEDRELLTAQQPFSDEAFSVAFVAKLGASKLVVR